MTYPSRRSLLAAGLVAVAGRGRLTRAAAQEAVRATAYSVVDYGLNPGTLSSGWAINNDGMIVATEFVAEGENHARTALDGVVRDLGRPDENSVALDLNDRGQVVGFVGHPGNPDQPRTARATLWQDEERVDLGALGGETSLAQGINALGRVVGQSAIRSGADSPDHACLWQAGEVIDLGTLGGEWSVAYDLNRAGHAVGISTTTPEGLLYQPGSHATLWRDGEAIDLGTLGGETSAAFAINNDGLIVGSSPLGPNQPAFPCLWRDGDPVALSVPAGTEDGGAADVNAHGQIVGFVRPADPADTSRAGRLRAALWEPDGTFVDLNDLIPADAGWILWHATGINDRGQIVGVAFSSAEGSQRAFLLTPLDG